MESINWTVTQNYLNWDCYRYSDGLFDLMIVDTHCGKGIEGTLLYIPGGCVLASDFAPTVDEAKETILSKYKEWLDKQK